MLSSPMMQPSQMHMFVPEWKSSINRMLLVCPALCAQPWPGEMVMIVVVAHTE